MMKKFAKYMPVGNFPDKVGHAFQASVSKDRRERTRFFIEMAPQVKPKPKSGSTESPFNWSQKKFISLDEGEMGNVLACFRGRLEEVNIVHVFPQDAPPEQQKTTNLNIKKSSWKGNVNWGVALKQKVGTEKLEQFHIFLSVGEVEILMLLLQKGIQESYEI